MAHVVAVIAGALSGVLGPTLANLVAQAVVGIAVSFVVGELFKPGGLFGPDIPSSQSFEREMRDLKRMIRAPASPRRIIYGEVRASGNIVFISSTGSNKEYLHIVLALATHEVESITDIELSEVPVTDSRWGSSVYYAVHLGDQTTADSNMVSWIPEWTDQHILKGIAYIYIRLKWDQDIYFNGIPTITAKIKGKKVYDPRTSTTAWSDNWALCVRDYLLSPNGVGADSWEIDEDSFITAANVSDELVTLPDSSTQKRYTLNGAIVMDKEPGSVLENMLTAGAGHVTFTQGAFQIFAGAYLPTPVHELTDDDLRGAITVTPRDSRKDLFNAVKGTYIDNVNANYVETDYAPITNSYYEEQDGGITIYRDLKLPFTLDPYRAQRIAKLYLDVSRQAITVSFPAKMSSINLSAMDIVLVSNTKMGWDQKPFRILKWSLAPDGIDLTLKEEAADAYDWNQGDAILSDPAPNTNLPDPWNVPPPQGVALNSGSDALLVTNSGAVISQILVTWAAAPDTSVAQYEIQYKPSNVTEWSTSIIVSSGLNQGIISPVDDGQIYDVRVRAVSFLGVSSDWVALEGHHVVGKSEPPSDVQDFYVTRQPDGTREFSWSPVSDIDLAGYTIRYTSGTSGTWDSMTPLFDGLVTESPWETNQLAAGTYTVAIKAVDTSGNESLNATYVTSTLGDPRLSNALRFEAAHLQGWPGTKTNCNVDSAGGSLTALSTLDWDSTPSTWDAWTSWAQNYADPITYEHPAIDFGAVIEFLPIISHTETGTATLTIAVSDDDITYGAWHTPSGPENARYMKVKLEVASSGGQVPTIDSLTIIGSGQVITETLIDQNTSTWSGSVSAGRVVPVQKNYSTITSVQVALQNVGAGWTWELISRDASGPTIKIYNGSGVASDATVDVAIRGVPQN